MTTLMFVGLDEATVGEQEAGGQFAAFDAALAAAVGRPIERPDDGESDSRLVESRLVDVGRLWDKLMVALRALPDSELIRQASELENVLTAERLLATARSTGSTGDRNLDRRRARNTLADDARSARSVNTDARRAAAVAANDHLGEQLASGAISPETIDALTRGGDQKTGAIPTDLIDAVNGLAPDQAARVVDIHLEDRTTADEVERHYRLQNKARRVFRYQAQARQGRPAMGGIGIEGPDALIDQFWAELNAIADASYRADGGRDRASWDHDPPERRRFDAVAKRMAGDNSAQIGGGRSTVVITIGAADLFDQQDAAVATQTGSGPLPTEILEGSIAASRYAVLVQAADGSPLWLRRVKRDASNAQFLALTVRDRGCVLCRATPDRCHAHHLMPWTAPRGGRTDVDQLALLCQRCHHDLHHRNHTLYATRTNAGIRVWATRPARADETPAPKTGYRKRE